MPKSNHAVQPKIVAAIPCFNTAGTIGDVVSRARKHVDMVMIIDDGSTDDTAQIAEAAGATVVAHSNRQGYASSIKTAFESARANAADVLVVLDGDAQHNPDEIHKVLSPILKDGADIAIGSRFLRPGKKGGAAKITDMPGYRRFGIAVITWLFNFGSRLKVTDAQSGFRAYSRRALEAGGHLTENGMGISVETLVKARENGFYIKEVPVTCIYHKSSSTQNPLRHGLSVASTLIKLRLRETLTGKGKTKPRHPN